MARKPIPDDDAPALTDAELAEMRPASEVLDDGEFGAVTSVRWAVLGRSPAGNAKVPVTIQLDLDIVTAIKATGVGWKSRIKTVLRKAARHLQAA